jgi:hypothetical protein
MSRRRERLEKKNRTRSHRNHKSVTRQQLDSLTDCNKMCSTVNLRVRKMTSWKTVTDGIGFFSGAKVLMACCREVSTTMNASCVKLFKRRLNFIFVTITGQRFGASSTGRRQIVRTMASCIAIDQRHFKFVCHRHGCHSSKTVVTLFSSETTVSEYA